MSGGSSAQTGGATRKYSDPKYPTYLRPVKSIDGLMPSARALVRNRSAALGLGLGVAKQGETVLLVTTAESQEMAIDAIKKAFEERGVKVVLLNDYDVAGVSKQDVLTLRQESRAANADRVDSESFSGGTGWFNGLPDPAAARKWLQAKNPALYAKTFPPQKQLSAHLEEVRSKLTGPSIGEKLSGYLDKHPEISSVFWGKGGSTYLRRYIHPYEDKMKGLLLADNQMELLNGMSGFPADVWQLAETQTLDPLAYIDKIQLTDPQGTNVAADLTEEQAQKFERGVYHRGHMFMGPNQAYGRFGYSIVDYPGFQRDWLSPEPHVLFNGVVAGTNQGGGLYPKVEAHFVNGYLKEVKGGGLFGDLWREALQFPHINEYTYPFFKHPGYFYLYEFALGTNPKSARYPDGSGPERFRAGVFHIGTGVFVQHAPDAMTMPKEWLDYIRKNNFPLDHGWHIQLYQATYAVHLRNANKWVNLVDGGRLTSLDSPEVRALASRYGNPATILADDWIPEIPGINAPGNYADFAKEPWKFAYSQLKQVQAGTYKYFSPAPKGKLEPFTMGDGTVGGGD
ncbi:MAG: hypothetical protein HY651_02945 [Acidobacteria bacterium]|nr:hypothetical protein [Acidobacteriota bacterium]